MARTRIAFVALWMGLLLVAGCASMEQPGRGANASVVMEEFMVPASDAGIELYVRNKHPAGMSSVRPSAVSPSSTRR